MKTFLKTALSAIAILGANSAQAATVTDGIFSVTIGSQVSSSVTLPSSISIGGVTPTLAGNATIATGQVATGGNTNIGLGWSPYGPSASNQWISLGVGNVLGTATYSLNQPTTSLQFVWGSPSEDNDISFYKGTTLLGTVSDNDSAIGSLSLVSAQDNPSGYLTTITSGQSFTSVVFSGDVQAFEFGGTTVSPVPIPGALPLFGSAVVGIGALARRRAKKKTV